MTVITHGFGGDPAGWVSAMCTNLPRYPAFAGTNLSFYQISITQPSAGVYATSQRFISGVAPEFSDSGEIVVALDWSTISTGGTSTRTVATNAAAALLSSNLIPELHGHALAELPLHLAGHSRGGSVVTEMARYLGASGVWVDHITTLDPHPVTLLGDPGTVAVYANVLFADNYWQNLGDNFTVPNGQAVAGAYNRQLTNLDGGDPSSHTDVHLWYHGTINLATPVSDGGDTITAAERTNWWTLAEARGTNSGFLYSAVGGGNRFSSLEPAGAGKGRISDGINKVWDLGAGVSPNRTQLPANNGRWPNVLRLDVTGTNRFTVGESIPLAYYLQFGSNTTASAQLRLFLDPDPNPFNSNQVEILVATVPSTGPTNIGFNTVAVAPDPMSAPPGAYRLLGQTTFGEQSRYCYAPEPVIIAAGTAPPVLLSAAFVDGQFNCTVAATPWQKVAIEASTNLSGWTPIQTNTFLTNYVFSDPATGPLRFYRAVLR